MHCFDHPNLSFFLRSSKIGSRKRRHVGDFVFGPEQYFFSIKGITVGTQAAGNGVDPAQKRTRPKHAFSGPEPPRDQRLLMSFRRVRQGRTNVFEKKLFGY